MSYLAVTTFPPWGWDVYARRCIDTWVDKWPGSVLAYYEGEAPPALKVPGVEFRSLDRCRFAEQRSRFVHWDHVPVQRNYLFDAKRFCHKVFAQLDAAEEVDQFYWLDADVEAIEPIPPSILQVLLEESFVAFLGRNTYTETGVIAFNKLDDGWDGFRFRYGRCYGMTDAGSVYPTIYTLPYWTDCHAFDYARRRGGYNMTPDGRGVENVLARSTLGQYLVHHKGNRKLQLETA